MVVTDKIDRTKTIRGPNGGGLEQDRRTERPRSKHRYVNVAFVAGGKGRHRMAAAERAVWMTEKSAINLTPLDSASENVWRGKYDLVIAGSEEPWAMRDVFLGNDEEKIVRHCPSDVLIVRYRPVAPSRRIVAAVDPDSMDRSRTLLALETLNAAGTFANWDDSELHVVNVIPSFKYYVLAMRAGLTAIDANNLEAEARSEQHRSMHQFIDGLDIDTGRMKIHLLQGDPVQKIANLVSQLDADLLVIGSAGRRGIGRWFIGNTAEEVMRQVSCSSLVVKTSRSSRAAAT